MTSSSTRSGAAREISARASSPSLAVRTSYPVFFIRNCSESRMFGSSSTMSTLGGLLMAITGFDVPV